MSRGGSSASRHPSRPQLLDEHGPKPIRLPVGRLCAAITLPGAKANPLRCSRTGPHRRAAARTARA